MADELIEQTIEALHEQSVRESWDKITAGTQQKPVTIGDLQALVQRYNKCEVALERIIGQEVGQTPDMAGAYASMVGRMRLIAQDALQE